MGGEVQLEKGRWLPSVHQWLSDLLSGPPGVICLDWDETCAAGDIGEALVAHLDSSGERLEAYERDLRAGQTLKAYVESLFVLAGLDCEEVGRVCNEAVAWALETGQVVARQEMKNLVEVATARGWEVWVVTASATPVVQAFSALYGLPRERVIGMELRVESGVIQPELAGIATYRQGKVDAIAQQIGKPVELAVGDTLTDLEMLCFAKKGLVIGPRHEELGREARKRGWRIQPIFEDC